MKGGETRRDSVEINKTERKAIRTEKMVKRQMVRGGRIEKGKRQNRLFLHLVAGERGETPMPKKVQEMVFKKRAPKIGNPKAGNQWLCTGEKIMKKKSYWGKERREGGTMLFEANTGERCQRLWGRLRDHK